MRTLYILIFVLALSVPEIIARRRTDRNGSSSAFQRRSSPRGSGSVSRNTVRYKGNSNTNHPTTSHKRIIDDFLSKERHHNTRPVTPRTIPRVIPSAPSIQRTHHQSTNPVHTEPRTQISHTQSQIPTTKPQQHGYPQSTGGSGNNPLQKTNQQNQGNWNNHQTASQGNHANLEQPVRATATHVQNQNPFAQNQHVPTSNNGLGMPNQMNPNNPQRNVNQNFYPMPVPMHTYPPNSGVSGNNPVNNQPYNNYPAPNMNINHNQQHIPVQSVPNQQQHVYPANNRGSGNAPLNQYPQQMNVNQNYNYPQGRPINSQQHTYPPSGTGSGNYPSTNHQQIYPHQNMPYGNTNTVTHINNNHNQVVHNTVVKTKIYNHYSPPPQIYYGATSHPVFIGQPPTYVYEYRNSGSRYGTLLAGLALYNLGRLSSKLDYHHHHHHDSYYQQTNTYRPTPGEICKLRIVKETGEFEEVKIDCQLTTSFDLVSAVDGTTNKQASSVTVTNVTQVTTTNTANSGMSDSKNQLNDSTNSAQTTNVNSNTQLDPNNPIQCNAENFNTQYNYGVPQTQSNNPNQYNPNLPYQPNTGNIGYQNPGFMPNQYINGNLPNQYGNMGQQNSYYAPPGNNFGNIPSYNVPPQYSPSYVPNQTPENVPQYVSPNIPMTNNFGNSPNNGNPPAQNDFTVNPSQNVPLIPPTVNENSNSSVTTTATENKPPSQDTAPSSGVVSPSSETQHSDRKVRSVEEQNAATKTPDAPASVSFTTPPLNNPSNVQPVFDTNNAHSINPTPYPGYDPNLNYGYNQGSNGFVPPPNNFGNFPNPGNVPNWGNMPNNYGVMPNYGNAPNPYFNAPNNPGGYSNFNNAPVPGNLPNCGTLPSNSGNPGNTPTNGQQPNSSNTPSNSTTTTTTVTTTSNEALAVKGPDVEITSGIKCFIIRTTRSSSKSLPIDCGLLKEYALSSIKRNDAL